MHNPRGNIMKLRKVGAEASSCSGSAQVLAHPRTVRLPLGGQLQLVPGAVAGHLHEWTVCLVKQRWLLSSPTFVKTQHPSSRLLSPLLVEQPTALRWGS